MSEMSRQQYPELRFKAFSDDWEKRVLGEVCSKFDYGLNASATTYDGKNKYIRITDIDDSTGRYSQADVASPSTDLSLCRDSIVMPRDILFARTGASVGKTYLYRDEDGVLFFAGFLIRANVRESYDPEFVFQTTFTHYYKHFVTMTSQRSGQPGINAEEYKAYPFFVASLPEQRKIGAFFRALDGLIEGREKALGKLEVLKKAMLEKMFPQGDAKVPEVRFKGFEGEWEEKSLGEIAKRVTRKNIQLESELPLTISAEHGLINQYEFFNNRVAARDVSGYYLIHKGEFAYNKSTSDGWPWGVVKQLTRYPMGVLSTLYIVFVLKDQDVDPNYITRFFETTLWHRDVAERAAEGARNHGLLNITPDEFFDIHILLPALPEQQKIGAYFRALDALIEARRLELDKLKQLKAGLLERMFA